MRSQSFLALSLLAVFAAAASAQPTYSKEVSRIVQAKCQSCHRPDDIAPFPLLNFEDASLWAEDIQRVISDRIMPPWKPVAGYGEFEGSYALTDDERKTILDWVTAGAPEGDPADLPEVSAPVGEWRLGEPDLAVTMSEEFTPPRGRDTYRCFVLPVNSTEDLWISAMDILPGNKQLVHHVILYLDKTGESERLDARDEGPGYNCFGGPGFANVGPDSFLGGWAPGSQAKVAPEGNAIKLSAGARVVMQVHYSPGGRTGPDITRAGLYLSKTPVKKQMYFIPVLNDEFEIPAGDSNKVVTTNFTVPPFFDAHLIGIFPHMHLLGRQIKVELEQRGKPTEPLIYIDDWDFKWQGGYQYVSQVPIPALSNVKLTCNFDNSENNLRNPNNPLKPVRWGEETSDEMCLAFLIVTFDRNLILPFGPIRNQKAPPWAKR